MTDQPTTPCDLEELERLLAEWRGADASYRKRHPMVAPGELSAWHVVMNTRSALAKALFEQAPSLIAEIRGLRAALISDSVTPTADLLEFAAARLVACSDKGTGDCDLTDYVQALRREAKKQRAAVTALKAAGTSGPGNGGIAATEPEAQQDPLIPVLVEALTLARSIVSDAEHDTNMEVDPYVYDKIDAALRLARGEG